MEKKNKKNITIAKQKKMVRIFWICFISPFVILFSFIGLTALGVFGSLPSFEELENPKNNLSTEVYSEDGQMIGSFFLQNRSYVDYSELSLNLVAALVSTEDARYYSHSGIDFISLARVGIKTLALGNRDQGGGSTITQQLAKNLFPRDTTSYSSSVARNGRLVVAKLKEWITAVKLEYNYTKEEIIAMYLNTVTYGSNAYGIKSAARTFFDSTPADLTVEQAALLVGVVNAPTRYSPVRNPERSLARRNTVIARMQNNGYISRQVSDSLQLIPIELDFQPISHTQGTGTYFREMLRNMLNASEPKRSSYYNEWDYEQAKTEWKTNPLYGWCNKNIKADGTKYNIYRDGLKIYTTINSSMQQYAEEALVKQMSTSIQPRMESQYRNTRVLFQDLEKEGVENIINNAIRYTDRYRSMKEEGASAEEITKAFNTPTEMKIFSYKGDIDTVLSPRDSILYHKRMMRASFVAMSPETGAVKAYVGGPDFTYFKYDMARQGKRQVGSTIKPFIYTFAIDQLGYNPCTMVPNLPTTIETDSGDAWQPRESGGKDVYDGTMKPLKWGLANSRNNYSAWVMKQAKQPAAVANFIHKMGISSYIDPVYALCLGTPDVSLYEMVEAYCTFVNRGVHTSPIFVTRIEDNHGNLLASFPISTSDVVNEQTAYTMIGMLRNVVDAGTAGRLRWMYGFKGEMGGKTGTTQNGSDAWYMGVTPKIVAGVWVGAEDRSVHLTSGGEGSALALPIYADFMKRVYADSKLNISENDTFHLPVGAINYDCEQETTPRANVNSRTDEFFD